MENIIIDLKIENEKLKQENNALKSKMTLMYTNWKYDYDKFEKLKEKCRNIHADHDNLNIHDK